MPEQGKSTDARFPTAICDWPSAFRSRNHGWRFHTFSDSDFITSVNLNHILSCVISVDCRGRSGSRAATAATRYVWLQIHTFTNHKSYSFITISISEIHVKTRAHIRKARKEQGARKKSLLYTKASLETGVGRSSSITRNVSLRRSVYEKMRRGAHGARSSGRFGEHTDRHARQCWVYGAFETRRSGIRLYGTVSSWREHRAAWFVLLVSWRESMSEYRKFWIRIAVYSEIYTCAN